MDDLDELQKRLDDAKAQAESAEKATDASANNALAVRVKSEIDKSYEATANEVVKGEQYRKLTQEITERKFEVDLGKDMLGILSDEHQLELSKYALDCKKEQLAFRKRKEKKVIIEEVKATIKERKVNALKKRYGYMYKQDANGNLIDFIPSKSYNRNREIANWWNGQSDNFRKYVKGTLKILFWGAVAVLIFIVGKELFEWIANASGQINK